MKIRLVVLALVGAILACGSGTEVVSEATEAPLPAVEEPTEPPADAPAEEGSSDIVTLTMANQSDREICYVLFFTGGAETGVEDELGATETVSAGDSREFDIEPGQYDLYAQTCDDEFVLDEEFVVLGDTTWTVSELPFGGVPVSTEHGSGGLLTITNSGEADICFVQIALPTDEFWGRDELSQTQRLLAGESLPFVVAPDTYDIRLTACDATTNIEETGVEVGTNTSIAVTIP